MGARAELNGPAMQIPHTLGTQAGPNLFHSFQRFNIPTRNSATFTGPGGTDNVVSRVTGGEASTIDGAFRSTIPGANVWFTNPAGVTFGPNASLDVPASFHASTANEIRFPDGGRFSADLGATSTLSVAPPEAFGFLSSNPAPLKVERSQLSVGTDATLSLAAGGIDIQGNAPTPILTSADLHDSQPDPNLPELVDITGGTLRAPSGTINLASVAGPAEVKTDGTVSGNNHGTIRLTDGALVNASGDGSGVVRIRGGEVTSTGSYVLASNTGGVAGAGGIDISADRLRLQDDRRSPSLIAANARNAGDAAPISVRAQDITMKNSDIRSIAYDAGKAGDIRIDAANNLMLTGPDAFIRSQSAEGSSGNAGAVSVTANNLTLTGPDAQIDSITFGSGDAGTVSVTANNLTLTGPDAFISSQSQSRSASSGNAGTVSVTANNLTLTGPDAQIDSITFGSGDAGTVSVTANNLTLTGPDAFISSQSQSRSASGGNAGTVSVTANDLTLGPNAQIDSITFGSGDAGTVSVTANNLTLTGPDAFISSQSQSRSASGGNAGTVSVTANNLTLTGVISSTTGRGFAQIDSITFGSGDAGTVSVTANNLTLTGPDAFITSQSQSRSASGGRAGTVSVTANDLTLGPNAQIDSITFGSGDAGTVSVTANNLTLTGPDAFISSQSQSRSASGGNAGTVSVTANNLTLTGVISSTTGRGFAQIDSITFGSGDAGTVSVTANNLTLTGPDAFISSQSQSRSASGGNAGTVSVTANDLTLGPNAQIDSITFGSGDAGTVRIRADNLTLKDARISSRSSGSGAAGRIILTGVSKLFMSDGASVTTQSGSAGGGNIEISGDGIIVLRDGSRIRVDTEGGAQAGDITIGSRFLVLDRSAISADADAGSGGNIRVASDFIFRSPDSEITARAGPAGIAGTVVLTSPETDVTVDVAQLPGEVMNTAGQMQERCAVRGLVEGSSFTIAGPEAQSPALEGYLAATYAGVADETAAATDGSLMVALGGLASPAWTVACGEVR